MSEAAQWTGPEAQAFDLYLQQELGIPAVILMENAAAGLADSITQVSKSNGLTKILLLCGTGNNGGDAITAARHLWGGSLELQLALPLGPPRPGCLAEAALESVTRLGLRPQPFDTPLPRLLAGQNLVVDALFGLGLNRPLTCRALDLVLGLNAARRPVLAVDLPSGLDATSGELWGAAVRADWTVSFVGAKQGFSRGAGPAVAGQVQIAGIGVRPELAEAWLRRWRASSNR